MNNPGRTFLAVSILFVAATVARAQADPLPSWNDGQNKRAIVDFVSRVTKDGTPDFLPVAHRIATFDNEAISRKWVVVDMKQDWKVIYPGEK